MIRDTFVLCLTLFLVVAPANADHQHDSAPPTTALLFENLGTLHHPVTTSSPLAQRYFDQGLRLVYAFNHDEATRSFQEAARLDPNCAMAYWGIALTLGPNYNLPTDPKRAHAAYEAIQKALALAPQVSEPERVYVDAQAKRYSAAPDADRKALDKAYADAMREVAQRYPADLDAATLFAEAMMDLRPWDLWTRDGQPQPGTLEIVSTLEGVLKKDPRHPGANHYYIHAVEPSPNPERAIPSAERLEKGMPGAGHLVHMPSHIYMRVGRYQDAAQSNARAAAIDEDYFKRQNVQGVYPMMYYPHNLHFLWAALSMEGRSVDALQAARKVVTKVPTKMVQDMPSAEFASPTALFALARFGKWKDILQEPTPPADLHYTTGIWHYVRGLAFTATGRLDDAVKEQASVTTIAAAMPPDRILGDNTPAVGLLNLAANTLAGEITAKRSQTDEAIRFLEEAVRIQDGLPYTEPPPWYYPVRQSLGAILLAAGRAKEAEMVYREDLKRNPENGWSLYGLRQSLRAQKKISEVLAVNKRFHKAWARADIKLTASRF